MPLRTRIEHVDAPRPMESHPHASAFVRTTGRGSIAKASLCRTPAATRRPARSAESACGRIGLLVLHHGKWNDKELVPAEWLTESVAPSQELNKSYGYLWWNNTTNKWPNVPKDAFAALGKWDNNIFVAPSLDLIVIRQSHLAPAKGHQIAEYYQLVCDAVKKP